MSPRESEPEVSEFARRVADAIADVIEARGISKRELARRVGRSNNYIAMRFRHEAAFTLSDVDSICAVLSLSAGSFIAGVDVRSARQDDYDKAASPTDPDRGEDGDY